MIAGAALLILAFVAVEDLRRYRIRNVAVLALAACFVLACLLEGRFALLASHALFATVALAALLGAFSLGWIGGGDAKLLVAALLWVGPEGSLPFALTLLACTAAYAAGAAAGALPAKREGGRLRIPFGPSVAAAWAAAIALGAA